MVDITFTVTDTEWTLLRSEYINPTNYFRQWAAVRARQIADRKYANQFAALSTDEKAKLLPDITFPPLESPQP